jgi:hypothetical protein
MDRGYDSDDIHRLIRQDLNADSIIPLRLWKNEIVGGTYRKEMVLRSDDPKYRRRQLVETTFSVLKRKFGGDLKAKKYAIQMKEITCKIIVYNIHKFSFWFIIEDFYRAEISKKKGIYFCTGLNTFS